MVESTLKSNTYSSVLYSIYHTVFVFHIVESTFAYSNVLYSIQPSMYSRYNTISIPTSMSKVVFNEILFFFLAVCGQSTFGGSCNMSVGFTTPVSCCIPVSARAKVV